MRPWLILREGIRSRWGGDLRRRYIFDGLLERTGGRAIEFHETVRPALRELGGSRLAFWRRPYVASAELLRGSGLTAVRTLGSAIAVDFHDEPVLQAEALGVPFEPARAAELRASIRTNAAAFRWHVAPSARFAALAGLDDRRVIVAGNGTDTSIIRAEAWPNEPAIGFISGAAPSRGIEELIEAARRLRTTHPTLRLLLWLAATGDASAAYLAGLTAATSADAWIEIGAAPYPQLSAHLGRATVLVIPTPAHAYWDSVAPIKLYDGMAAGRPTVTTPRAETAAVIRSHDAGLVAAGDTAPDLAVSIGTLLGNEPLARRLGAAARSAAEADYDWRRIGARLAADLLDRVR